MNLQNHFLIAMPSLQDPLFKYSVVYICEHSSEGAIGIIINKPVQEFTIKNILNQLKIIPSTSINIQLDNPVFTGGPLLDARGFILHTPQTGFDSSIVISPQTMMTTSKDVLETIGTKEQPDDILIALGYSGWSKGQLEEELLNNSWLTIPANNSILFHTPASLRWNEAIKILGIKNIHNIINTAGHA